MFIIIYRLLPDQILFIDFSLYFYDLQKDQIATFFF